MIDDNQNTSLNTRENVVSDLEERERVGSRGSGILGRRTSNILHRMAMVKFIEKVNLNLMEVRDRVIDRKSVV